MVFSFFSRKSSATVPTTATTTTGETQESEPQPEDHQAESDAHVAGTTSSSAPFDFPKEVTVKLQAQPMVQEASSSTAPVLSTMPSMTGSPPPMPPPHTPSPAPEPEVTDPRALHRLISSVPSQTLLDHCLTVLDPESFDAITGRANKTKKRRRKSGITAEDVTDALKLALPPLKPHPVLTPSALQALTAFFRELVPPPQLHCVRCHKQYFELENSDYSCRVAHDDDSTVVERVGTKIVESSDEEEEEEEEEEGEKEEEQNKESPRRPRKSGVLPVKTSVYETLWGCCNQTVEGDGDQGPPDGWCYEGRHTTDAKRARFRADSTPQDDKLKSCHRMKCARPQVSQGPESTGTPSVVSGAARKRKRNTRASIDYREAPDDDEDLEEAERRLDEDFIVDDDAKSAGSVPKRRKKDPSTATPGRGRGRGRGGATGAGGGRKKTIKIQDEVKDDDSMQVDEPQAGPSTLAVAPRSPPPTPAPQLVGEPSTATKPKKPRGRPPGSKNKPKPSPLAQGVQREDTLPADDPAPPSTLKGTPGSRSQVFVELGTRQASKSPSRGAAAGAGLTRADIRSLKAKSSVASLRDKFEGAESEKKAIRVKRKPLDLGEVVGSSVDNEIEMSG